MESFIGSVQSWLGVAAATLAPLIALLVGFVGTDRWLRWKFCERQDDALFDDTKAGILGDSVAGCLCRGEGTLTR
jgi:hypothetical protein